MGRSGSIVAAVAVGVLALVASAQSTYSFVGSFAAPAGSWTVGADGRVWALDGATIRRQTAIHGSTYEVVGTLDAPGGILSLSPDGTRLVTTQGSTLRAANIASLSTGSTTTTTATTLPGTTGEYSVGAWSGNQFFVSAGGPIASGGFFTGVLRMNFGSGLEPTSAFATRIDFPLFSGPRESGPVAIGSGTLYWAMQFQGADPDSLRVYFLNDVLGATVPNAGAGVAGSYGRATGLALDGFGVPILDAGTGFSSLTMTAYGSVTQNWFVPSGVNPNPALAAASIARPTFNPVTFELLALAPDGSISRFSIPSPTAASLLCLGALAACRRRR